MTLELKRKVKLDTDICCVKGCLRRAGLKFILTPFRGEQIYPPYCPKHLEELLEMGPVTELSVTEEGEEDSAEEATDLAVQDQAKAELSEAREALEEMSAIEVDSHDDFEFVSSILTDIKGRNKKLEEMKQSVLRPLRESEKTIRGWFSPAQSAYSELEAKLKGKLAEYSRRLEQERRANLLAAESAAKKGDTQTANKALAKVERAQAPVAEGVQMRKVWKYTIEDTEKVPKEYWVIDESLIRQDIKDGVRAIPGVNIYQEDQVIAGST